MHAAVLITIRLRSTPNKELFAFWNWMSTVLLIKQRTEIMALRLNSAELWAGTDRENAAILNLNRTFSFIIPTRGYWPGKHEFFSGTLGIHNANGCHQIIDERLLNARPCS